MIKKSFTKSSRPDRNSHSNFVLDEICSMCDKEIPDNKMILRHEVTKNILCLVCLVHIAEITIDESK